MKNMSQQSMMVTFACEAKNTETLSFGLTQKFTLKQLATDQEVRC
jgi:hypothetical protein